MTDKGSPCSITYIGKLCWASTELMNEGGKLLIGTKQDMERSRNRVKSKLATDRLGVHWFPHRKVRKLLQRTKEISLLSQTLPFSLWYRTVGS